MKTDNRTVFVPELNGSIAFTRDGGHVHRSKDHWFIDRNGRHDEEIINEALDEVRLSYITNPVVLALFDASEAL